MQQLAQSSSEELDHALVGVHQAGANRDLVLALLPILTKAAVLVSLTLCISSFATLNIFTISAMMMVYLVGHLESIARYYWTHELAGGWLIRGFPASRVYF